MEIPEHLIGYLIGKNGETIGPIEKMFDTKVIFNWKPNPKGLHEVCIFGKTLNCLKAKQEMERIISKVVEENIQLPDEETQEMSFRVFN